MKSVKVFTPIAFTLIAALMVIVVLAGCATTDTTAPASAKSNVSDIIPPSVWKAGEAISPGTIVKGFTGREFIAGQEKDVLTIEVTFTGQNKDGEWGNFFTDDKSVLSKARTASGVRFKAMGDGKKWIIQFHTKETMVDWGAYAADVETVNNEVVDINIPYSSLKQPAWGKKATFVKKNILIIGLQRQTETASETGTSTLKVFDLELY
jgi:hypothetical protein